ncbi:hypothetical protein A6U86_30720 [Rhizobium sp. AC27/96]|nr:hypothetical protein A6U86_30720 [Rhizobium sp. AC27/96]
MESMMLFRLLPAICFIAMLCGIVLSIAVVRIGDVHIRAAVQYSGVDPINGPPGFIRVHAMRR